MLNRKTIFVLIITFAGSMPTVVQAQASPVVWADNGNSYQLLFANLTWTQANAAAQANMLDGRPGHLVTITSAAENSFVANLAGGDFRAWIGLSDAATEGSFEWVTGEPLTYTRWSGGEPNNSGGVEDYVELFASNDSWNDRSNFPFTASNAAYIIEWEAGPPPSNVFSIAIIPDTQIYVENHPEIFEAQIQWILDNRTTENIVYVAHLGDLKDSRICDNPTVTNGSGNNRTEWKIVDDAFERLDMAGVPYGVVPGNHDFDSLFVEDDGFTPGPERCGTWDSVAERPLSLYNSVENFQPTRFTGKPFYGDPMGLNNSLGQAERGNRVDGSNEDNFTLFEGTCGLKFVAVNLAYKEGANAIGAGLGGGAEIDWADRLLKLYPDRLGIVTSHHFLAQNPDIDPAVGRTGFGGSFSGDYGADVYNGLTDPNKGDNPNLVMMLSAHERGEAWRGFPTNAAGDNQGALRRDGLQPLHAILSDYQSVIYPDDPDNVDYSRLDGDRGNPGDGGFMRIMRFDPDTQMVEVRTFAPAVSFLDTDDNPYTYNHRANAPDERTEVLWSDYFPADSSGSNAVGTQMDKDTASNFSFSFAGYGAASAANTCMP